MNFVNSIKYLLDFVMSLFPNVNDNKRKMPGL